MFSVEKVTDNFIVLENLETLDKVKVDSLKLKNIKESDIVIFKDGNYEYSEKETLKRKNKINALKDNLKVLNRG